MRVFIKTSTRRRIAVEAEIANTVYNFKESIQDQVGKPPDQQRLVFAGEELEDGRTLSDYDIPEDSTIDLVTRRPARRPPLVRKPIIYLLAPSTFEASVELSLIRQWSLSAIYPVVPVKPASSQSLQRVAWRVQVHPNGELTELSTGIETAFLFWEALANPFPSSPPATPRLKPIAEPSIDAFDPTNVVINDKNAVLIRVERITPYLDTALKALGLHTEARSSFITYWLPDLLKHTYVALRFLPQASYEQAAMLNISPIPDVVTRIFMVFQGIRESDLESWLVAGARAEQDVSFWVNVVGIDIERTLDKGLFRVIEWGGMEVHSN